MEQKEKMIFFKGKSDKGSYNAASEDFIPIACHYDQHTLLTKNGELVQTIQINGINAERVSKKLFSLREVVREAIRKEIDNDKIAFWIHTIRRKANLDDNLPYNNLFSANLHNMWQRKNYWRDKFVNCLYITVIYDAPELKLKNFNSLLNSLSIKTITKFENSYFAEGAGKLTAITDKLVAALEEYGAIKLGVRLDQGQYFSDPMFLYRRIIQLSEEQCLLPITDISLALSSHQYAVGNDMIEVIGHGGKKFAALMSIKEYHEISSEALDQFLQIPVEMVATEVFYFVDKMQALPLFADQAYITEIGGDKEIRNLSGLDKILESKDSKNRFCHQQISFMVIGDNAKQLNNQVKNASETLAKIGIAHVREDINLEKAFWAQLPGNFSFLYRMSPTILDNTAALASLHNFPTGNQYNPWGRAVTLLRTEKGTPYFMNFHNLEGNGNVCIIGVPRSGKTTLLNFLLSEADKFKPTILHFTEDSDSMLYIKAKGGKWISELQNLANPLSLEDTKENREFCLEFFKIIAGHYFDPLKETELEELQELSNQAFLQVDIKAKGRTKTGGRPRRKKEQEYHEERTIQDTKRRLTLSELIEVLAKTKSGKAAGKEGLSKRLADYAKDGLYYGIFEAAQESQVQAVFQPGSIVAVNLEQFDDSEYQKKYYPKEKKLVEEFEYNFNKMRSVKAAIVYVLQGLLARCSGRSGDNELKIQPKITAIDSMSSILDLERYSFMTDTISKSMKNESGVFISTMGVQVLDTLYTKNMSLGFFELIGTKLLLPLEIKVHSLQELLKLSQVEIKKLESLNVQSRMFLIQQDDKTIAAELSIGGLPGIMRFLSAQKSELDIYTELTKRLGDDKPETWMAKLYEELNDV